MIDALRYDFIDHQTTPFLYNLKESSVQAKVIETVSFQTRPAYFAGLEPDVSNICHLYEYNPEFSPFTFLKPYSGGLKLLDILGIDGIPRRIIKRIARRIERSRGFAASADVMDTAKIPLDLLPYFAFSERGYTDDPNIFSPHKTFFDILREKGISWNWIGYPRHFGSAQSIMEEYRKSKPADLSYLHFSELDWIGHKYGPNSSEMARAKESLDGTLKKLLEVPLSQGSAVFIFGDHGMVEVTKLLDLKSKLESLPLKLHSDFIYFLDSTQARFWFRTETAREVVTECLNSLKDGRILREQELKELHLNFSHNRYGDLIFAINGGSMIHPSFFASSGMAPKGMHGYTPEVLDNMTQVFYTGKNRNDLGVLRMTGIFELLKVFVLG